ncbi:hypothetical protein C0995_000064 [Termitomyces sp. Mi166|nr:hypothetical protein C0995_000064 [Termitomyces sp. Mi166\
MSTVAAALLHRIQNGLSKHAVELVYISHSLWPVPKVPPSRNQLRILVLDASFNPPTLAHLALANSLPPLHETNSNTFDNHDYDAKLLLLSVRNADKILKPGDASYLQRLEMLEIFAQNITSKDGLEPNVAIAMIDEPTFVGKSKILQTFIKDRFATLSQRPNYHTQLYFVLGFDTFERLVQPRYYGSEQQMMTSLRHFFSPEGDNSSVVCGRRASSSYPAESVNLAIANEFISTGRINFVDIGEDLSRYSSSEVRNTIRERGLEAAEWKKFVPSGIVSLISAVAWVRRGVAERHPRKYVLDDKELERVSTLARIELEDARIELERAHEAAKSMGKGAEGDEADDQGNDDEENWVDEDDDAMDVDSAPAPKPKDDDLSQYQLDDYDDDIKTTDAGPFSNIKGLTYYKDNEEDPYITLKEDDNDEREELEILPTDNLVVIAKTEDEISQLEIYVYDESEENLYAHHDLMLPNFPLCLEWLDFPPASSSTSASPSANAGLGNYIAVGTLDPEIEIWSLDTVEAMYPNSILGRPDVTKAHVPVPLGTGKKKKKKTKHRTTEKGYHVDAVLGLSWNKVQRNLLASASADRTVKLWDLSRDPTNGMDDETGGGAIRSFDVHKDKVQAVQWNEKEPSVLLTGSYDRTVRTFDSRSPTTGVGAILGSDVEALRWDPWEDHGFYVSLENGIVLNFDVRTLPSNLDNPSPARFTLSAHDGAVSALDINPHIKGCVVTGGTDKLVKVWNVTHEADGGKRNVSLVTSRDLGVGKVFSAVFSPDDPLTIAAAGSKAKLQVWNVGANMGARKAFGNKLREAGKVLLEKEGSSGVVGVVSDDEDSDAEDGEED